MSENKTPKTYMRDGIPEIDVDEVHKYVGQLNLIDVRRPEEFNNELGHIKGAQLITLGPELQTFMDSLKDKEQMIVFICRSGARSGNATLIAREMGFNQTYNMTGGMIRWNDFQLPVSREDGV